MAHSTRHTVPRTRHAHAKRTMPAKNLGTLAMIYATDELKNPPLPLKTMLCEGDMNNPVGRSDAFLHS